MKQVKKLKNKKGRFLSVLFDTLGTMLLGNLLTGKGAIATSPGRKANIPGRGTIIGGKGTVRAGQDF